MRRSADPRTKVKRWTVVSKEMVKCREVERRHEQLHESRDHGDTGDGGSSRLCRRGNPGPTYVTAVTATGYTIDVAHVTAGCTVAQGNYTLGGRAVVTGHDVAPGTPSVGSYWTGLTIKMNDLLTAQDACKGAVVTITFASS